MVVEASDRFLVAAARAGDLHAFEALIRRHQGAVYRVALRMLGSEQAIASGRLSEPSGVEISPDKTVAVVALSIKGSGTDAASERSLETLRSAGVPATVGELAGTEVAVNGLTAVSKDLINVTTSRLPIVFGGHRASHGRRRSLS